jgi:hypothetical protein
MYPEVAAFNWRFPQEVATVFRTRKGYIRRRNAFITSKCDTDTSAIFAVRDRGDLIAGICLVFPWRSRFGSTEQVTSTLLTVQLLPLAVIPVLAPAHSVLSLGLIAAVIAFLTTARAKFVRRG